MCDVPCISVFYSESIECFLGTASKCFLKLLVTIPVALIITGIIVHMRFHIRCISVHKLSYFNLIIIIIIIIIIILSLLTGLFSPVRLLNQCLSPPFRVHFHTAVLSVFSVMFLAYLSYVVNLLNIFLAWLPNFSLKDLLPFHWIQFLPV